MSENVYDLNDLICLLGEQRFSDKVKRFLDKFGENFLLTIEPELDYQYLEFKNEGFCLLFKENILRTIFLFTKINDSSYNDFDKGLPIGICFNYSIKDIIRKLGKPDDQEKLTFRFFQKWIKYNLQNFSVHIEFSRKKRRVQLITIEGCKMDKEKE